MISSHLIWQSHFPFMNLILIEDGELISWGSYKVYIITKATQNRHSKISLVLAPTGEEAYNSSLFPLTSRSLRKKIYCVLVTHPAE